MRYPAVRSLLFRFDPERVHRGVLELVHLAGRLPPVQDWMRRRYALPDPGLEVNAFGLTFPNALGLAAGYDKDGRGMHGLACLGFGHLELGTVTPEPQPGNPRPRLFRLPEDRALINQMGFPNQGAEALARRLRRRRPKGVVIGVNLGKGVATPLDRAIEDYTSLLRTFHPLADYLVINVSSPNTLGLRRLQARGYLDRLLEQLVEVAAQIRKTEARRTPLLVKLAPDLDDDELADAVAATRRIGMDGIIATNTTLSRSGLRAADRNQGGGLSGKPLSGRATEVIRRIAQLTQGELPVIGVGGIFTPADALEKLEAGATLVQVYTGLVYQGPGMVPDILAALRRRRGG
jgi:dihydroorotate dehydrogenase